jgi:hypothetical protein
MGKKKKLNCSLLNYSHINREPNFGKTLGIPSTPLIKVVALNDG